MIWTFHQHEIKQRKASAEKQKSAAPEKAPARHPTKPSWYKIPQRDRLQIEIDTHRNTHVRIVYRQELRGNFDELMVWTDKEVELVRMEIDQPTERGTVWRDSVVTEIVFH